MIGNQCTYIIHSFVKRRNGRDERRCVHREGCSSWKIDIHLNHKSELSQCLLGGNIIIAQVLDYTLCRAEARAACKCALLCYTPTTPPTSSPPHTHPQMCTVRSSHWDASRATCDVGLVRGCQATSWDRSTRVYNGLRHVSSITPSMNSLQAALDLEE